MNKNVKDILVNTINSPEMEKLFKKYEGNEEMLSQILGETISELIEEENPYRWKPVSPATFLTDPYYLGVNPKTGVGVCETLYPKLFEDFCKIHDKNSTIEEVILTGSIGYGKSFFMELSILWQVYVLSCLKNPQKYFKLAQASKISIMIISVTEKQSKKNIFATVKNMITAVPYFNDNFMFDKDRASESLLFPNNVEVFNGTSAQSSAIGLNIYSATLDEANFFKKVSKSKRAQNNAVYDEALILYNSLKRRQESRFLKAGRKPGILYIGSSKVYPNDFTARRIKSAKVLAEETGVEKTYIMDYNLWAVNRDEYSKEEFQVEIGGMNSRSRILVGNETDVKGKVISVPMDFYDKFYGDIDNSIRDIAGEALFTVMPFIGNKNKIADMWDESIDRVFSVDEATLSPKPKWLAIEYIIRNRKIRHPERPRYVAVDIGLKHDKFGFAMGYIKDMVMIKREYLNHETGNMDFIEERLPHVEIEMILKVKKEEEFGEVELSRVRFLIFQLIKQGYKIRYFSADGFQSADMQQILRRKGIKFEYISMDRTPEPYECLRDAIYQDRLSCIYHQSLEKELNELERDYSKAGKIDHPPHGCFVGDTKIKLLNGKNVEIKNLVGMKDVELYGCKEDGEVVPVVAKKIWETKKVNEYLEITLDNGEIIKCTPEHKFMLLDGTYKEAQYLKTTESLMPLYTSYTNHKFLKNYEMLFDNKFKIGYEIKPKKVVNHKIVSIKKISVKNEIPVYDIEVPQTNNFALSAGIFVHNSKDTADALGQLVYNATIHPVYADLSLLPISGNNDSIVDGNEYTTKNFDEWARKQNK